jgi:hypothetical protein
MEALVAVSGRVELRRTASLPLSRSLQSYLGSGFRPEGRVDVFNFEIIAERALVKPDAPSRYWDQRVNGLAIQ